MRDIDISGPKINTPRALTCAQLTELASEHGLTLDAILSRRRTPTVCVARDAAMAYLRAKGWTYSRIGAFFGRDHSTALVGVQRHEARVECH